MDAKYSDCDRFHLLRVIIIHKLPFDNMILPVINRTRDRNPEKLFIDIAIHIPTSEIFLGSPLVFLF